MLHLSVEDLTNYVDAVVAGKNVSDGLVESHLSVCAECFQAKEALLNLIVLLQRDASFEPPGSLVEWAFDLFQPMLQPTSGGKLKRIIASLIFDTYEQPMLAGVRRMGAPPRQLLFRAGEVDVDVKVESLEANDRITLIGQVLSNAAKFFDNTPVKLESQGVTRFRTVTNVVGEFSFDDVPKDTYHLSVDLPEGEITLFCVHRGNS